MILLFIGELFLALVVFVLFYNFYYKRRNLPPGPTPLPIIGNYLTLLRHEPGEDAFIKWRKEYGDVYTYWLGEQPVVAVTDYQKIIDTFQKDGAAYEGRLVSAEMDRITRGGSYGVVLVDGDLWREHRRFALSTLRDFGLGKNLMQERVLDEVVALLSRIDERIAVANAEVELPEMVDFSVGSIINSIIFGYRYDESHRHEFHEVKRILNEAVKNFGHPLYWIAVKNPHLYHKLPIFRGLIDKIVRENEEMQAYYVKHIEEHEKDVNLEEDAPPRDFVEAYMRQKAKLDKEGQPHLFTYEQMIGMCGDLFGAGQETSSTTLAWGFNYLINWPQHQERVHEELDRVIGSDRLITVSDRSNLPFTNAVLCEIQRLCNLVPNNVLHTTTREVVVDGYVLPAGTCITPQISVVLYDDTIYKDPKCFNPTRFIDEQGNLKRSDELIPFSVGKRQCLGEGLARMELFLFLANLLNHYKFLPGAERPSLKRCFGGAVACPPYKCKVVKRH